MENNLKVCKFGGTSMADSKAIENVASIISSDPSRRFVVVSAPGKRSKTDEKVTDLLYKCADEAENSGSCAVSFSKIRERFSTIVKELNLELDFDKILDETEKEINASKGNKDFSASRGEYLNAIIMAKKLNFNFVDAKDIIFFDDKDRFDSEYTNDKSRAFLLKLENAVIPGFYGTNKKGKIKTFSRGGSDVSGSIIARAVKADIYENWTDVSGFLTCDPRIVSSARVIDELSYKELRELSYMGASVLHADAIFPVRKSDIPINIKNTFAPEDKGTLILPSCKYKSNANIVTGIAGKKDFTVIFIEKSMMNSELGFARKVLTVLEYCNVSFEHMPSGIDTLSLVISSEELKNGLLETLVNKIRESVQPDNITVMEDICLIATVGHGMAKKTGTAGKLFSALARNNINVKMIDQGSSELNIIVGVANADYEKSVRAIYDEFII